MLDSIELTLASLIKVGVTNAMELEWGIIVKLLDLFEKEEKELERERRRQEQRSKRAGRRGRR